MKLLLRRPWWSPWFVEVWQDLGEDVDWRGRRYHDLLRRGTFFRRSTAEAFARWLEMREHGMVPAPRVWP